MKPIYLLCIASLMGVQAEASRKLLVTGSSTVAPLASSIAKRFESEKSKTRVDVQTGGSSRGIADVRRSLSDIGMVSRDLKAKIEDDLISFPVAKDGIAFIVHKTNPAVGLSTPQALRIYTGQVQFWNTLLVNLVSKITVVHKASGRSTQEVFLKYFRVKNSVIKPHVIIGDNEQGIKTVAGNPNAIGYVSIGAAETAIKNKVPIKILRLDGFEASTKTVQNGKYPLSRTLNLVTTKKPYGLIKDFLDFAQSKSVADLVESHSFVPIEN